MSSFDYEAPICWCTGIVCDRLYLPLLMKPHIWNCVWLTLKQVSHSLASEAPICRCIVIYWYCVWSALNKDCLPLLMDSHICWCMCMVRYRLQQGLPTFAYGLPYMLVYVYCVWSTPTRITFLCLWRPTYVDVWVLCVIDPNKDCLQVPIFQASRNSRHAHFLANCTFKISIACRLTQFRFINPWRKKSIISGWPAHIGK